MISLSMGPEYQATVAQLGQMGTAIIQACDEGLEEGGQIETEVVIPVLLPIDVPIPAPIPEPAPVQIKLELSIGQKQLLASV